MPTNRQKDYMNKRIASLLISAVLIIIAVGALNNPAIVYACDNAVLLEKRHPGYWEYLRPEKMIEVQTIPGFEEISTEEIKAGNVLKDFYQGNYGGVDISYCDGVMKYSGTAKENIWSGIAKISNLETGTYFVSAGTDYPSNARIYLEGFKDGQQQTLVDLDQPAFVYIDTQQYDGFKFTVGITNGTTVDFSINPILYRYSDQEIHSEVIGLWKDVPVDLSEYDWDVFKRSLNTRAVIQFHDGSVKKYDGQWINAEIDEFGKIG